MGMASPSNANLFAQAEEQNESDYGSDFSPEDQEIVNALLAGHPAQVEGVEDNPIVTDVEYHEAPSILRVSRVLGRERGTEEAQSRLDFKTGRQDSSALRDQSYQNRML